MAKETIGHAPCPCCNEDAHVRVATSGKAYIVCTSPVCGFQGFTRSIDADRMLRGKMKPVQVKESAPAPEPKPQPQQKTRNALDDFFNA